MPARTLGLEGRWIVRSHISWGGDETFFIRVWKPLPSKRILKTLRRSSKGKAQKIQYRLEADLDCNRKIIELELHTK